MIKQVGKGKCCGKSSLTPTYMYDFENKFCSLYVEMENLAQKGLSLYLFL